MKRLVNERRGFTLIEVLVALAITAVIMAGASAVIFQLFQVNSLSNNHMMALREVQNAGYWISQDIQMTPNGNINLANDVTTTDRTEVITLTRDLDTIRYDEIPIGPKITVIYSFDNGLLKRWEYHGIIIAENLQSEMIVAYNLDSISYSTSDYKLNVSSTYGDATKTRVYEIYPRPS